MPLARILTSTVAAAAIALSGLAASATPARAGDDLVKFLAGATALVVIGAALSDRSDRRTHRRDWRGPRHEHRNPRGDYRGRPIVLPHHCAVEIDARNRARQVYYRERCLTQAGIQTWRLPRHCEATMRAHRRSETVYPAECLRREGFRVTDKGRRWH